MTLLMIICILQLELVVTMDTVLSHGGPPTLNRRDSGEDETGRRNDYHYKRTTTE